MTNEEKAREIAKQNAREYLPQNPGFSMDECNNSALEMAEYKDSLIRVELEEAIEKANKYYDENLNKWRLQEFIGQVIVLSGLLGEEFPKDRLHMRFAVMD